MAETGKSARCRAVRGSQLGEIMNQSHILLVEDNPDDEELTVMALEKSHVTNRIVVARDGAEALQEIFGGDGVSGERAGLPTVILLDLKLPKVNGIEVLRRIREDPRTKHIPVVVLTSSQQDEDALASYELRANAFVRKPVSFTDFSETVTTLGLFWVLVNEPPPQVVVTGERTGTV